MDRPAAVASRTVGQSPSPTVGGAPLGGEHSLVRGIIYDVNAATKTLQKALKPVPDRLASAALHMLLMTRVQPSEEATSQYITANGYLILLYCTVLYCIHCQ